jgi:hypothetical protein
MLQALLPLPFISITILPSMYAIAFSFRMTPLPYVRITVQPSPDAIAMLKTLVPFTIVDFSVIPWIYSFAMGFTILETPVVWISIWISLKRPSVSYILEPIAFVLPSNFIPHDSLSVSLAIYNLA